MPELTGDPNSHPPEEFNNGLEGSCLCGSITVKINDNDLFKPGRRRGHICHCANCRKVSGNFGATNLIIDEGKVEIHDRDGTLKKFIDTQTKSGTPLSRFFCSTCGNPIKSVTPEYPGVIVVKMGIFPRIPAPEFETFGIHRHPWQGKHDGMKIFKIKAGPDQEVLHDPAKAASS